MAKWFDIVQGSLTNGLQAPSMQPYTQLSKSFLHLMILTVKKYYCNYRWNSLIFHIQNISSSKFFACHILNFYKNHMFPFEQFPRLINHILLVVSLLGTTYLYEELFFKMKHAKSMLNLQLSNHHLSNVLLLSASSLNIYYLFL